MSRVRHLTVTVLAGKLAEILRDTRPARKVTAMFIDMAFGSPVYERLRALGFPDPCGSVQNQPLMDYSGTGSE